MNRLKVYKKILKVQNFTTCKVEKSVTFTLIIVTQRSNLLVLWLDLKCQTWRYYREKIRLLNSKSLDLIR
jgi:hypothetical protein